MIAAMLPAGDADLIQIVDAALMDAARRSGPWLACRPGCSACCHGVFAISSLDAARLRAGYTELQGADPSRANALAARTKFVRETLAPDFPGNPSTGILGTDEDSRARFDDFANDEACPVLDPLTGTCDLYAYRPMTCRVFGPPVRSEDGLGVCELCFQGASEQEIAAAEMLLPDPAVEASLTQPLGEGTTIVAFVFVPQP